MKNVLKIAADILAGMQIYDVTSVEMQQILKFMKQQFGTEAADPIWRAYLTKQEGTSNKFHYFAVFEKDGVFIAANAYGRIGYTPRLFVIDKSTDFDDTLKLAKAKMKSKVGGGYIILEENEYSAKAASKTKFRTGVDADLIAELNIEIPLIVKKYIQYSDIHLQNINKENVALNQLQDANNFLDFAQMGLKPNLIKIDVDLIDELNIEIPRMVKYIQHTGDVHLQNINKKNVTSSQLKQAKSFLDFYDLDFLSSGKIKRKSKVGSDILKIAASKKKASVLIDTISCSRPGLSKININIYSTPEEYLVTFSGGAQNLIIQLGRFPQGKVVPDLKAEKAATDFAKKIKHVFLLSSVKE
jgi:predicted small secreted protein